MHGFVKDDASNAEYYTDCHRKGRFFTLAIRSASNWCKHHVNTYHWKILKAWTTTKHSMMKRFKFHIFYSIFADAELNVGICKFTGDKCGTCDAQFISNSSIA